MNEAQLLLEGWQHARATCGTNPERETGTDPLWLEGQTLYYLARARKGRPQATKRSALLDGQ